LRLLLAEDSRRTLQAFRTLSYLESHLAGLDMSWGPGGSVGYELASGIQAVRSGSDLDFILFAPKKLEITEAQDLKRPTSTVPGRLSFYRFQCRPIVLYFHPLLTHFGYS
jgi:phosphoribosyl-dephospho-CoA transferase